MKKRLIAIFLSATLLLTSCSESGGITNANGYDGIIYENTSDCAVTAADIPGSPVTGTSAEETTGDTADNSGETTPEADETEETSAETRPTETTAEPVTTPAPQTSEATTTETTTVTTAGTTAPPQTTAAETTVQISNPGTNSYSARNYNEVKGIWISYIELAPIIGNKTKAQFSAAIKAYFQNCADMGLNTVYVHVRSHGDAYYPSDYFPWTKYACGTIGSAPSYDPLEVMIEQAHALGLSFQAWINPFRLCSDSDISKIPSKYQVAKWYSDAAKRGEYIVKVGSYWYLNPGYGETITLIANGVAELVSKYNVDGVHIDDYFYPTTDASFDTKAFAASGYSDLGNFRRACCDNMVKALYKTVKAANSTALFGISTQGNIYNNYNYMYADVEKWCAGSGYADYMAPQIYYGFKNSSLPFETNVAQWQKMVAGTGIKLIPGLAVYKIGESDAYAGTGKSEWINDKTIIARQITASRAVANYGGIILYSYNYVFAPTAHVSQIEAEMAAVKDTL